MTSWPGSGTVRNDGMTFASSRTVCQWLRAREDLRLRRCAGHPASPFTGRTRANHTAPRALLPCKPTASRVSPPVPPAGLGPRCRLKRVRRFPPDRNSPSRAELSRRSRIRVVPVGGVGPHLQSATRLSGERSSARPRQPHSLGRPPGLRRTADDGHRPDSWVCVENPPNAATSVHSCPATAPSESILVHRHPVAMERAQARP